MQVPLHTLHTAAWNWPQPERFWPERWTSPELRGGPKNGVGIDGLKTAFLPFGASCISARVAETQVRRSASPWQKYMLLRNPLSYLGVAAGGS